MMDQNAFRRTGLEDVPDLNPTAQRREASACHFCVPATRPSLDGYIIEAHVIRRLYTSNDY